MTVSLFETQDIRQIKAKGIAIEEVLSQIDWFRTGFPFCRLNRPCRVGDGIRVLSAEDLERLSMVFSDAARSGRAMKFVPASGAATRMFKDLLSAHNRYEEMIFSGPQSGQEDPDSRALRDFITGLKSFAFYRDLKEAMSRDGLELEDLIRRSHYKPILEYALTPRGINLAGNPKGLIPFHTYGERCRTPFEEHLVEGMAYACDVNRVVRVHFSVSPEYESVVRDHLDTVRTKYENAALRFDIGLSLQKPATDTLAVDMDNRPFRDDRGNLLFRPGGHGALLENLGQLEGDIVFVKNIDNVAPDRLKGDTFLYKRALGGLLVELQDRVFDSIGRLKSGKVTDRELDRIFGFALSLLSLIPPKGLETKKREDKIRFLVEKLDRPLRVCGMVRNEGEPGGGPFWVTNPDGAQSLQIVESSQVDMDSSKQKEIWRSSTHFNPVDLVCGLRDYQGKPYDLKKYRDPLRGLISKKSADGRELKAVELPGLWNGSMAFWNTVFIEVPISTFNPVKTIFDLLREEHQVV